VYYSIVVALLTLLNQGNLIHVTICTNTMLLPVFNRHHCYNKEMVPEHIKTSITSMIHVKWIPCHHSMARPQVADRGDGLQVWTVASNILNKQSRTADRGWPSSLGVGRGSNNPPP
jgi:hypothetical protein